MVTALGEGRFMCDYETDIPDLPNGRNPGSTAIVIETCSFLVVNGEGEWKRLLGNGE